MILDVASSMFPACLEYQLRLCFRPSITFQEVDNIGGEMFITTGILMNATGANKAGLCGAVQSDAQSPHAVVEQPGQFLARNIVDTGITMQIAVKHLQSQ